MLKGNARSLNKLMRLHFLNYILSFIIHIVTITYIVTCFFYIYRVVDDWNSLPSKVVEARDVEQFKAELDEAWKDIRFLHTAL